MSDWIFRVLGAEKAAHVSISQLKTLLLMFGASDLLSEFLRVVKRHGPAADIIEVAEIRESFLVPLLNHYCGMMTHIVNPNSD